MTDTLLAASNIKKYFPITKGLFSKAVGYVHAVDGVIFQVKSGKILGLVGESGCRKTTTGKTIVSRH